jgi:hypothetical protein
MPETRYRNRQAHSISNDLLQITVTIEGGHIAELLHRATHVNPLWSPPWNSIDPSTYNSVTNPEYGGNSESKLLAGILGHNLCLDLFGPPSADEAAAGLTVHGEASVARYDVSSRDGEIVARCRLPIAQLAFERRIQLKDGDDTVYISETVENLSGLDHPIAWTQHVTLGPPFLEKGKTLFRLPAGKSRTLEGVDFDWPILPHDDRPPEDLRVYTDAPSSGGYTAHLLDAAVDESYFMAWSPASKVLFGYIWRTQDFPWIGIWEENHSRHTPPWNGETMTRGMEFGVSPIPETRRQMIDRKELFGTPGYRWLPAKSKTTVEYRAFIRTADSIPEDPF